MKRYTPEELHQLIEQRKMERRIWFMLGFAIIGFILFYFFYPHHNRYEYELYDYDDSIDYSDDHQMKDLYSDYKEDKE